MKELRLAKACAQEMTLGQMLKETELEDMFKSICAQRMVRLNVSEKEAVKLIVGEVEREVLKQVEKNVLWQETDRVDVVLNTIMAGMIGQEELLMDVVRAHKEGQK